MIHERNGSENRPSTRRSASQLQVPTTKNKLKRPHRTRGGVSKDKNMNTKGAIEVLGEVHQAGKEHPDFYDSITVNDEVVVAAIVELSKQLEHFKQSKQDKISPAQVQAMSKDLTRGALATKLSRALGNAADKGKEKDVALRIYQFLESL
jgi:hypothetical protein